MKAVSENLYRRGKSGTFYVRRRIPATLRVNYPGRAQHVARIELTRIDIDFRANPRWKLVR
jgi:hypothetical protein